MSSELNSVWLARAGEMMDYWQGKLPAKLIQADIDSNDLESLQYHVLASEALATQLERENYDIA